MLSIVTNIFFWLGWVALMTVTWSHVLVKEVSGWWSSCANCWGDWSAHLTYTTSFAYGHNWPVQLPIMTEQKFSYPFLIDWLSAILIKLGLDLRLALIIPGWILSLIFIFLIVNLGEKLTGKKSVGMIASFLFLFNGGKEFLNIITAQLIPQRGFLLGMILSIVVYLCFWQWLKKRQKKYLLAASVVTGLLPLAHFHSFIVIVFIAGWFLVMNFSRQWLYFFLPMGLLAAGQIWEFYGGTLGLDLIKFKPGWLAGQQNWISFWLMNMGLVIPMAIYGLKLAKRELRRFIRPFWGLFILGNLFILQPFDWDNTKIFNHWYLMMAIFAGITIERMLLNKHWWLKVGGVAVFLVSIFPGLLETVKFNQYQQHKYLFFNNQQLALAKEVRQIIEPNATILTASNHNHWLPALTGRKIVLGYGGWLWSYGIDYQEREKDIKKIYQGDNKILIDKYKINYVLIGPEERKQFSVNENWFKQNFSAIILDSDNTLYQNASQANN